MKKRILTLAGILALVVALVVPAALVYAETGSVTVTGGALSVTPAAISLAATELTGGDLEATSAYTANTWTAIDPVGAGAGWNVTIISTDFGINEVQTITITGTPTGGTFTLTYSGNTTAAITFDATAAAIVTALEALENIVDVTATGGSLPGTPVVVTFVDPGKQNIAAMTATSSLTGGSSPAIVITTTTQGRTINISASDQEFKIQLVNDATHIVLVTGNTEPVSDVAALTAISEITPVKFAHAAVDTGMGTYQLKPNFLLEIPAETYIGAYTATFTVTINSGP